MLSLFTSCVFAQGLRYALSNPFPGNGTYSRNQPDVFAFTNNQAALVSITSATIGIYGERRYLLTENSMYSVAAAIPTKFGSVGVQMKYAGYKNFNESEIGIAYARSLGNRVGLGIQFNYYHYRIPAYGNAAAVNVELGAIVHLTDKLSAGVHCYNPVSGKLGKSGDEKLASVYKIGAGYDASEQFFVSIEVVKEEDKPVNVTGAVKYQFKKQFFVRAGFLSGSSAGFAGIGVSWKNIRIEVTTGFHPQLGLTPGLVLITNFKAKK